MSGVMVDKFSKRLESPELPIYKEDCYADFNENISFANLKGEEFDLNSFNDKVLFINLWQTTCIPCIAEMKSIGELYETFRNREIEFIFISNENPEIVIEFWNDQNFPFSVYTINPTVLKESKFNTRTFPVTFIINRNKKLVLKDKSASNWSSNEVIDFIEELL